MKLLIFTKGDGPESRQAVALGEEIISSGYDVVSLDAEKEEAATKLELYDIYSYPSFLIIRETGEMIDLWRGQVPIKSEVITRLMS